MAVVSRVAAFGAVVAALVVAAPVAASPPTTGSGTGTIGIRSITTVREAGGNVIQERTLEGAVTGTLQGTYVEHVEGVIHPSGLVTFHGTMTFTGSIAGCGSGTVTLGLSGTGVAGAPVTDAHARVINAAGNTLDVHGVGEIHQVGPAFTYEVQVNC